MNKRPLPVTIISCLYMVTGAIGFVYHFSDLIAEHRLQYDTVWIEVVRLIPIVCGVFMLRGRNWARWLAVAWITYHVILSAFHSWLEFTLHSLLFAAFAYFLFRPSTTAYFRSARR